MSTPTKAAEIRGPITHELKCHPEPFQAVKRGDKPFEWRKDDRDYRVGDTLRLCEWLPGDTEYFVLAGSIIERTIGYTGEEIDRRVTYIIREGFGIPDGYCIMGLADLDGGGEVVAWMDPVSMFCISDKTKKNVTPHDGKTAHPMAEFTIPLYTHPSPTSADAPPDPDANITDQDQYLKAKQERAKDVDFDGA